MRTAANTARMLVRITGLIQIVLGVLFWIGSALSLIPVHMLVGIVLVLSLWALAILAAVSGVNPGLVALVVVWSLLVPLVGFTQTQLLPGPGHWAIQVIHLLLGVGAIGFGERLAAGVLRRRALAAS